MRRRMREAWSQGQHHGSHPRCKQTCRSAQPPLRLWMTGTATASRWLPCDCRCPIPRQCVLACLTIVSVVTHAFQISVQPACHHTNSALYLCVSVEKPEHTAPSKAHYYDAYSCLAGN